MPPGTTPPPSHVASARVGRNAQCDGMRMAARQTNDARGPDLHRKRLWTLANCSEALSESESSDNDSVIPFRETRKAAARAPIHDASDTNDDDADAGNADSADEGSEEEDELDEDV